MILHSTALRSGALQYTRVHGPTLSESLSKLFHISSDILDACGSIWRTHRNHSASSKQPSNPLIRRKDPKLPTMPEPLSEQLRQEVTFYLQRGDTNKMIFDATNMPKIRIRKLRKNWVTTGSVVVHAEPAGRPKKLRPEHEKVGECPSLGSDVGKESR